MTIKDMQKGFEALEILTKAVREVSLAMGGKYDDSGSFQLAIHECEIDMRRMIASQ